MEDVNLSSPAQVLSSSPFSLSSASSDAAHSSVFNPQVSCDSDFLQKLSSNLEALISPDVDENFSDVLIYVDGRAVPAHRCILAARCDFFRTLFSQDKTQLASLSPIKGTNDEAAKLRIDLKRLFNGFRNACSIGYDAFKVILGFLYSGKLSVPPVKCIDNECSHEYCRPVVEFATQMLCLSSVLDIPELRTIWQSCLVKIVEKAQVDEVLPVLIAADAFGAGSLLSLCKHLVAVSNIDTVDVEKQLPSALAEEVIDLRLKQGLLQPEFLNPMQERECQKIRRALDSNDVELVQLLLKEGRITLDGAHALHYATSYCDPHTVQDILELGLADPNLRNNRGYTVLHLASLRRDPVILSSLLIKGAKPLELTPDGRSALQLCRRLINSFNQQSNAHSDEESHKDTLSVEILDQAGKKNPFADTMFPPAVSEKDLFMRLLYLENRVAVARLLFPQQAKLVIGLSHLEATSEFTGLEDSSLPTTRLRREAVVDHDVKTLNQNMSNKCPVTDSSLSAPIMNDALLKRVQALQKTVELGKSIFPHCSRAISNFMDDDLSELSCIEKGNPEEQIMKKRRYNELKDVLAEAFRKDVAAMDRHRSEKVDTQTLDKVDT